MSKREEIRAWLMAFPPIFNSKAEHAAICLVGPLLDGDHYQVVVAVNLIPGAIDQPIILDYWRV